MEYHNPVLLQASVDGLNIKPDGICRCKLLVVEDIQRNSEKRSGQTEAICFRSDEDALANALPDEDLHS
jgi:16S rRNA (cytosine1402-N4)-methyltransferase